MIRLNELIEDIRQSTERYHANTTQEEHLSSMAICGLKYRYEKDNNISVPYSTKYMFGLSVESYLVKQIQRRDNSYISHFLVSIHRKPNVNVVGSTDVCSLKHNHIIEIKTSSSDKYKDIYLRQLKAYMISYEEIYNRKCTGSIWQYNTFSGKLTEYTVDVLTSKDYDELSFNLEAFTTNSYISGIQNSLCGLCVNFNCPANQNDYLKLKNKSKLEVK